MTFVSEAERLETAVLGEAGGKETAVHFEPAPYMNPYLAGIGLGLVLLSAFVIMGRGLGASGAFASLLSWLVELVAPAHAQANEVYSGYLQNGIGHPLKSWLVFEVIGVAMGGLLSGVLAHRVRRTVEKGPRITSRSRSRAAH
jgi:uncharacterized protein